MPADGRLLESASLKIEEAALTGESVPVNKVIEVLGVDATVDGCNSIKEGDMAFTVYQSGKGQGNAAVEMALRIVRGDAPEQMEGITENGKYVWVPFEKVDRSNVGNYGK